MPSRDFFQSVSGGELVIERKMMLGASHACQAARWRYGVGKPRSRKIAEEALMGPIQRFVLLLPVSKSIVLPCITAWALAQPPVEREAEDQGAQDRERDKPGPTVAARRVLGEIGREHARRDEHIDDECEGESILDGGLKRGEVMKEPIKEEAVGHHEPEYRDEQQPHERPPRTSAEQYQPRPALDSRQVKPIVINKLTIETVAGK